MLLPIIGQQYFLWLLLSPPVLQVAYSSLGDEARNHHVQGLELLPLSQKDSVVLLSDQTGFPGAEKNNPFFAASGI